MLPLFLLPIASSFIAFASFVCCILTSTCSCWDCSSTVAGEWLGASAALISCMCLATAATCCRGRGWYYQGIILCILNVQVGRYRLYVQWESHSFTPPGTTRSLGTIWFVFLVCVFGLGTGLPPVPSTRRLQQCSRSFPSRHTTPCHGCWPSATAFWGGSMWGCRVSPP